MPRPNLPWPDAVATALALLPDAALLATVCTLTARSNATLAALLAHLGEVEARGLHRQRACPSLYTYCVYELRMSEDAAFRRARAAGLVRRFPEAFGAVARGELHLTGLLQLGPHLTTDNVADLLARARYRTRREIARLVAEVAPRPDAPAMLEPLGPEPAGGLRAPTHAEFTAALAGPVRSLPAGHAPADWLEAALTLPDAAATGAVDGKSEDGRAGGGEPDAEGANEGTDPRGDAPPPAGPPTATAPALRYRLQFTVSEAYVALLREVQDLASHAVAPEDLATLHLRALEALAGTLRRRRHASRTPARGAAKGIPQELPGRPEGLVRRAADTARSTSRGRDRVAAAARPDGTATAHPRQRGDATAQGDRGDATAQGGRGDATPDDDRGAAAAQPRPRGDATPGDERVEATAHDNGGTATAHPRQRGSATPGDERAEATAHDNGGTATAHPRQRGDEAEHDGSGAATEHDGALASSHPRQRGALPDPGGGESGEAARPSRYVPAADRRAVWHRDGGRCTHVDDRSLRCRETRWLEVHHLHAHARGGPTRADNLTLRCRAHNALACEQDFGRDQARRARAAAQERSGAPDQR